MDNLLDQNHLQRTHILGVWPDRTAQPAAEESGWWTASMAQTGPKCKDLWNSQIKTHYCIGRSLVTFFYVWKKFIRAIMGIIRVPVTHKTCENKLIPPSGRVNPLRGIWKPHRGRKGGDRCPVLSLPNGTSFGVFLPPAWATWDALLSVERNTKGIKVKYDK